MAHGGSTRVFPALPRLPIAPATAPAPASLTKFLLDSLRNLFPRASPAFESKYQSLTTMSYKRKLRQFLMA